MLRIHMVNKQMLTLLLMLVNHELLRVYWAKNNKYMQIQTNINKLLISYETLDHIRP